MYALIRSSFNGMSTTLCEDTFQACQSKLFAIARHYQTSERASFNRDVCWLTPGKTLEITDQGLGMIGNDCGIYAIHRQGSE